MENWIRKAFNEAEEESKEMQWAQEIAIDFMDKHSGELLDVFCAQLPEKLVKKIAKFMVSDDEVNSAFQEMCGSFFLTGFINGYHYEK